MQENIPLAPLTTLRIGGPARYLAKIDSEAALLEAVDFARSRALPLFVLGGGSNLLVADSGFAGVVLQVALSGPPAVIPRSAAGTSSDAPDFTVPAGNDWDAFVLSVCEQGIAGIECLAGIPGLVGGTPVQNVGAYGQEVADSITQVRALDLQSLQFVTIAAADCAFSYRRSRFNSTDRGRYIVTAVSFRFDRKARPTLNYADLKQYFNSASAMPTPLEVYHAVREIRYRKGMLLVEGEPDCRSAGSFFKNPIVPVEVVPKIAAALTLDPATVPNWPAANGLTKLPAAWLLERAGFHKGFALGRAGISSRHTLALINRGGATQADLVALRNLIQKTVADRFAIELEQEPVLLP